jgi:two-component system chemotaxis sensor kinase CheA
MDSRPSESSRALAGKSRTLRVDIDKLDRMLNLTGEIAIARGRLTEMLTHASEFSAADLLEAHQDADRLYLELQEQVMKVRMVRIGPLFRQFSRTIRDVAGAAGKVVRLVIEGEEVEVDTAVIENIRDPLAHMIRNAIDHGIEAPEVRAAAGKDPCGLITLGAYHAGGSIVIRMTDDGAGFDRERIIARAREIGYIFDADKLTDQDVYRMVFEAGFSTAESVTGLSGRGVGMDVVRRNIESLRGTISVESRAGRGATITVRLPLTLAIIDGFSVGVGGETYVVPLDTVVECLELPGDIHTKADNETGVINLRGEPLPFLRLRDHFDVLGDAPERESVVVVQYESGRAGIAVDGTTRER